VQIVETHSHLNGYEWLAFHQSGLLAEIEDVIASVDADKYRTKVSKEKTMQGKLLYSPPELNKRIKEGFEQHGWAESRTSYWVTSEYDLIMRTMSLDPAAQKAEIEAAGKQPIFSYNQTDFVKNGVAVEVQFGKYAFIAYDLFVKHLAFYVSGQIEVGIEILPMKSMQAEMSSGPGYYESALYDLARGGRGVPSVPLWLIGIDA
jgi:hypothetical protein